jgi:hypothetical protein
VSDHQKLRSELSEDKTVGFWKNLLMNTVRDNIKFVIAFAVGTVATGIICWYYSIPLAFSLLGGLLVLGIPLAAMPDIFFPEKEILIITNWSGHQNEFHVPSNTHVKMEIFFAFSSLQTLQLGERWSY